VPVDPDVSPSSKVFFLSLCLSLSLPFNSGAHNSWSGRCPHLSGSSYANAASRFFFRFGGDRHSILLIFCNPLDIPAARFTNSSPKASMSNPSDILSILRCNCRLISGFFISLLPRSCCFRPRSLMPLLHSGPFQRLSSYVHPFWVSSATMSWSFLLRSCPLRRATFALQVILIPAAVTLCREPEYPQVRIFLKTFLLRRATPSRRDTFLQAAASFLRDPLSSFGSPRRPATSFWPLCRFFRPLTGFTMASSLGTSLCSD
jgi:hypothetical protein